MRYAAKVAYDGTAYAGFQRQRGAPSIQQTLETALAEIAGQVVTVVGAGRTDAGVHASGQVIAFDLDWRHGATDLRAAMNARLPQDIAVREVWEAKPKFHPRYDAVSRTYLYRIVFNEVRDPLRSRSAWQIGQALDIERMADASECLLGTHDFLSFGLPPKGDNSVREIMRAEWHESSADEATFAIEANAFLFRMVRAIVGTLAQVGQHRMTVEEFRVILSARQRGLAAAPAPACGLTLIEVKY